MRLMDMHPMPQILLPVFDAETRFNLEPHAGPPFTKNANPGEAPPADRRRTRLSDLPCGRGIPFSPLND